MNRWARAAAKKVFGMRLAPSAIHRWLAWEYTLSRLALDELSRIFYYQPMFEAQCAAVGSRVRLELCPDSKFPSISNVRLELGDDVRLSARTTFSGARNASPQARIAIGDHSYIGHRVVLRAGTEIVIGKHVLIATNAVLSGDPGHPLDAVARRTEPAPAESLGRIEIGDDAWVAYNVTIVGEVTVGAGAVIAAGSVVTRDVPAHALVAGNPARVLRMLDGSPMPGSISIPESVSVPSNRNVVKGGAEPLFEGFTPTPSEVSSDHAADLAARIAGVRGRRDTDPGGHSD